MADKLEISALSPALALALVEAFLVAVPSYSATRLGREAKKDPGCVFAIRQGREPRRATIERLVAVIETASPGFTAAFMKRSTHAIGGADHANA